MSPKSFQFVFMLLYWLNCDAKDEDWSGSLSNFDCLSVVCKNKKTTIQKITERMHKEIFDMDTKHLEMHFQKVTAIPTELLMKNQYSLQILDFSNNEIKKIAKGDFPWLPYVHTLLLDYNQIEAIEPRALDNLTSLHTLSLVENKLERLPIFLQHTHVVKLDASFNHIRHILSLDISIHKSLEELYLQKNRVTILTEGVFKDNVHLVMLDLSNNPLKSMEIGSLEGPRKLYKVNLRNTKLTRIPSSEVSAIRHLDIRNIPTLWSIPEIKDFRNLEKIEVTYSVHCCAFRVVSRDSFPLPRAVLGCNDHTEVEPSTNSTPSSVTLNETATMSPNFKDLNTSAILFTENPTDSSNGDSESFWDLEKFFKKGDMDTVHNTPTTLPNINTSPSGIGKIVDHFQSFIDSFRSNTTDPPLCRSRSNVTFVFQRHISRHVKCLPPPDAFNPCDDVMGSTLLRVLCWFVVVLALIGNVCQVIVIYTNTTEMTVYKLLMYHLAIANFIMGLYLLVLCCLDAYTYGQYHNFSQGWQYSGGCKVAGFLAIFSAELAISILFIVTIERYLLIVHALRAHWQIRIVHAKIALLLAWTYAFTIASLPLTDVISSYNKVAICLPFEVETVQSKTYVLWLLSFNAGTFLYIAIAYCRMYLTVNEREPCAGMNTDLQVAKRMSLIMFSNFGTWIPISIAGCLTLFTKIKVDIETSKFLLVLAFPLNAWTNPFLYAFFTRIFQDDVITILRKLNIFSKKHKNTREQRTPCARNRYGSRASDATNAGILLRDSFSQRKSSSCPSQSSTKSDSISHQRFSERVGSTASYLSDKRDFNIHFISDSERSFLNISEETKLNCESTNNLIVGAEAASLEQELTFGKCFEKYNRARSISEALNPADEYDYESTLRVIGLDVDDLSPVTGITNI